MPVRENLHGMGQRRDRVQLNAERTYLILKTH